jgi:hypothetical protein
MGMGDLGIFTPSHEKRSSGRPRGALNKKTMEVLNKADSVAATMLRTLERGGYTGLTKALSYEDRLELSANVVLSIFEDAGWRKEFAAACLVDPLAAANLAIKLKPKDVRMQATIAHQHSIIVPATASAEEWNQVHAKRKQLSDGDWGTELSDLAFTDVEEEPPDEQP